MKITFEVTIEEENYKILQEYGYAFEHNIQDMINRDGEELLYWIKKQKIERKINGKSNKTVKENRKRPERTKNNTNKKT